jgi:hypothetical protein
MNPSLHGSHRGCKIIAKKQQSQSPRHMIEGRYCTTHHVDLCSCGFTWDHGLPEEIRKNKQSGRKYGIRGPSRNETLTDSPQAA